MIRTLIDPVAGVPKAVEGRHWVLPMLLLCVAVAFSGLAFAYRLDASAAVLAKMEESGELAKASERELGEEVQQAQRIALVGGAAKGIFLMPLMLLATAVALKIASWLVGRKLVFAQAFTTAAIAFVPVAIFHLLFGLVALKQTLVSPAMASQLVPSSIAVFMPAAAPHVARALQQLDFFNLWTVALLGLGLAAGTKMKPVRGVAFALLLYVLLSGLQIGLPGLMNPGGGGPS